MTLHLSVFALVLQFCISFSLFLLLLLFFFFQAYYLILLYPSCSAFEVESLFLPCSKAGSSTCLLFFGGGGREGGGLQSWCLGTTWKCLKGVGVQNFEPSQRFGLCQVEMASVPGWQMTTRHSFPRPSREMLVISRQNGLRLLLSRLSGYRQKLDCHALIGRCDDLHRQASSQTQRSSSWSSCW